MSASVLAVIFYFVLISVFGLWLPSTEDKSEKPNAKISVASTRGQSQSVGEIRSRHRAKTKLSRENDTLQLKK